ncbi:energy-coupling factor ABC transporter ATP-binding protein [Janibacter cremeus]|uniref:Biotin transport system ATP-binding protein n=1 Tax=Janibacter cremeus TaxID=1285192 RepID=A0A852VRV0_9MICO|nr:ABC transporter ATP-binding protein [Janibacter cremeus]NYF98598.1 biotin transport system ATP-binding protein [Janibacter cremeus]
MSIRFEEVHLDLGDRTVLRGVDAELTQRRVGIIGANGSGKSSLARTINALVRPTRGRVLLSGRDVAQDPKGARRAVGFLFPDATSQIVMPTVREDLEFSVRGLPRARREAKVEAALVDSGLADHADHPCHLLSSGQQQQLALAAVLLVDPEIVVADEPTTLLDLRNQRAARERFTALRQQLVLVTHHLELLEDFDRVLLIADGVIAADGAPAEVIDHYERMMA